jgi:hypothetical protein
MISMATARTAQKLHMLTSDRAGFDAGDFRYASSTAANNIDGRTMTVETLRCG